MHQVTTFHYQSHQFRSVLDEEQEPWFIAKDVCEALDLENVSKACQNLPDDEKLISPLVISGQSRDILTVSESGLYRLIFRSNKPEAEKFRRWVFHDVLPQIRKTGTYTLPSIAPKETTLVLHENKLQRVGYAAKHAAMIARSFGYGNCHPAAQLMVNELVEKSTGVNILGAATENSRLSSKMYGMNWAVARFLSEYCAVNPLYSQACASGYHLFSRFCDLDLDIAPYPEDYFTRELLRSPLFSVGKRMAGCVWRPVYEGFATRNESLLGVE